MPRPTQLHQTESKSVYFLQTHRNLLKPYSQLDVHPNNNGDAVLKQIKTHYQLPHHPFFMHQVHGANSIALNSAPKKHFGQSADACYTTQPNIICPVMTADCLPVLITDQKASFVAAVHCGWRSLYQSILTRLLDAIQTHHGLIVWFGPAICVNHYQVGDAFKKHYLQAHPQAELAFTDIIDKHCFADLKSMALSQLKNYDLVRIQDSNICTLEHENYDSWRQNKTTGRQASMIWIKAKESQD